MEELGKTEEFIREIIVTSTEMVFDKNRPANDVITEAGSVHYEGPEMSELKKAKNLENVQTYLKASNISGDVIVPNNSGTIQSMRIENGYCSEHGGLSDCSGSTLERAMKAQKSLCKGCRGKRIDYVHTMTPTYILFREYNTPIVRDYMSRFNISGLIEFKDKFGNLQSCYISNARCAAHGEIEVATRTLARKVLENRSPCRLCDGLAFDEEALRAYLGERLKSKHKKGEIRATTKLHVDCWCCGKTKENIEAYRACESNDLACNACNGKTPHAFW